MLKRLFWMLAFASIFSIFLQIMGYSTLEITLLLIISSVVLLEIIRIEENEYLLESTKHEVLEKIHSIEKMVDYIFKHVLRFHHENSKIENKIEEHKNYLESKINSHLDRFSRKLIEIENKISEIKSKHDLFHNRLSLLEDYIFEEEEI